MWESSRGGRAGMDEKGKKGRGNRVPYIWAEVNGGVEPVIGWHSPRTNNKR